MKDKLIEKINLKEQGLKALEREIETKSLRIIDAETRLFRIKLELKLSVYKKETLEKELERLYIVSDEEY